MKPFWCDIETQYSSALQDYVRSPNEAALHRAYELGRKALDDGLGVLEIAVLYHKALVLCPQDFEGFMTVMPAQAGIQELQAAAFSYYVWIPVSAGMTPSCLPLNFTWTKY